MEESFDGTAAGRLAALQESIIGWADVCSSGGVVGALPGRMAEGLLCFGIGLVVCHRGGFDFTLSGRGHSARGGQTVFIPEGAFFSVDRQSPDLLVSIIIYKTEPIRYVLGTMVQSVRLYSIMSPEKHCVWSTGDEDGLARYVALIGPGQPRPDDFFAVNERKLLLLSLTYRLCALFGRRFLGRGSSDARRTETFLKLVRLIDRHYTAERGVALRLPSWCRQYELTINGETVSASMEEGFLVVRRVWQAGDQIRLSLNIVPEIIYPDARIRAAEGKVCVCRGPVVYCAESHDNDNSLDGLVLQPHQTIREEKASIAGEPCIRLVAEGRRELPAQVLYSAKPAATQPTEIVLHPYALWNNRGDTGMRVFFPKG